MIAQLQIRINTIPMTTSYRTGLVVYLMNSFHMQKNISDCIYHYILIAISCVIRTLVYAEKFTSI